MSKNELAAELEEVRANGAKYHSVNNHQAILAERLIKRERRMSEQVQYSQRECIKLVGLHNHIDGEKLENAVVKTFQVVEINIGRRNFHAVQRLAENPYKFAYQH